jgi:hypothetical protein
MERVAISIAGLHPGPARRTRATALHPSTRPNLLTRISRILAGSAGHPAIPANARSTRNRVPRAPASRTHPTNFRCGIPRNRAR